MFSPCQEGLGGGGGNTSDEGGLETLGVGSMHNDFVPNSFYFHLCFTCTNEVSN